MNGTGFVQFWLMLSFISEKRDSHTDVIRDGVYKNDVKKSFRVPRGNDVNVKDFNVGDALDSLSQ
ncbi:hypothetical protein J5U22_02001 [Saccharolobus shibatae]|uniref:Uncharacterized protein n=1 Tax=Saccharolobus shibatae TaxID=2286 RepID=A0A8F5C1L5_9CREN|nr:hypothetical protein [Saccharolobus shibatae]QXJ35454.1 hypothetical protein J5U22_02001 [Saccharolobus shibatae]